MIRKLLLKNQDLAFLKASRYLEKSNLLISVGQWGLVAAAFDDYLNRSEVSSNQGLALAGVGAATAIHSIRQVPKLWLHLIPSGLLFVIVSTQFIKHHSTSKDAKIS